MSKIKPHTENLDIIKGRGAQANPHNRFFKSEYVSNDDPVMTWDEEEENPKKQYRQSRACTGAEDAVPPRRTDKEGGSSKFPCSVTGTWHRAVRFPRKYQQRSRPGQSAIVRFSPLTRR